MELFDCDEDPQPREGVIIEELKEFIYLGATLSIKNDSSKEMNICIIKTK